MTVLACCVAVTAVAAYGADQVDAVSWTGPEEVPIPESRAYSVSWSVDSAGAPSVWFAVPGGAESAAVRRSISGTWETRSTPDCGASASMDDARLCYLQEFRQDGLNGTFTATRGGGGLYVREAPAFDRYAITRSGYHRGLELTSRAPGDAGWSRTTLSTTVAYQPQVVLNDNGDAVVAWESSNVTPSAKFFLPPAGHTYFMVSVRRGWRGKWSVPFRLTPRNRLTGAPVKAGVNRRTRIKTTIRTDAIYEPETRIGVDGTVAVASASRIGIWRQNLRTGRINRSSQCAVDVHVRRPGATHWVKTRVSRVRTGVTSRCPAPDAIGFLPGGEMAVVYYTQTKPLGALETRVARRGTLAFGAPIPTPDGQITPADEAGQLWNYVVDRTSKTLRVLVLSSTTRSWVDAGLPPLAVGNLSLITTLPSQGAGDLQTLFFSDFSNNASTWIAQLRGQ